MQQLSHNNIDIFDFKKNSYLNSLIKILVVVTERAKPRSFCPKTSCLDGKIRFWGVLKKMIVRFTGLIARLFFFDTATKMEF